MQYRTIFHPLLSLCIIVLDADASPRRRGVPRLDTSCATLAGDPTRLSLYPYPIVLQVPDDLIGRDLRSLSAFARQGGAWHPRRVQVDEVNDRGDYVLEDGRPFTRDTDDKILDANDEIVLDGLDAGEPFDDVATVQGNAHRSLPPAHSMWRIDLCTDGNYRGSFLLVEGTSVSSAATTQAHAVRFLRGESKIVTDLYTYQFHPESPLLIGPIHLGLQQRPAIDSARFALELSLPWLPDITLSPTDLQSEIESWQVGPLRTIVAVGAKFRNLLSIFNLHMFSELVFYRNALQIPTVLDFPFSAQTYLEPGSGVVYTLDLPDSDPWQVRSNLTPLPARGPAPYAAQDSIDRSGQAFWIVGSRKDASFAAFATLDPAAQHLAPPALITQEALQPQSLWMAHWRWLSGYDGDIGMFLDLSSMQKGVYQFGLDLIVSHEADDSFTDYGKITYAIRPMTFRSQTLGTQFRKDEHRP